MVEECEVGTYVEVGRSIGQVNGGVSNMAHGGGKQYWQINGGGTEYEALADSGGQEFGAGIPWLTSLGLECM